MAVHVRFASAVLVDLLDIFQGHQGQIAVTNSPFGEQTMRIILHIFHPAAHHGHLHGIRVVERHRQGRDGLVVTGVAGLGDAAPQIPGREVQGIADDPDAIRLLGCVARQGTAHQVPDRLRPVGGAGPFHVPVQLGQ